MDRAAGGAPGPADQAGRGALRPAGLRAGPRLLRAGLWLIVGGGLGNLYDRLTRGGVADFIELAFVRFAVFNVADICICVGAALAALGVLMTERRRAD